MRRESESCPLLYRCRNTGALSLQKKPGYELLYNDDILDGSIEIHQFKTREALIQFLHTLGDEHPGLLHSEICMDNGKPTLILTWDYHTKSNQHPVVVKHSSV